jgi:hypothetical protein
LNEQLQKLINQARISGEKLSPYILWEAHNKEWRCNHDVMVRCKRTIANGNLIYGEQCRRCGHWAAKKREDIEKFGEVGVFDSELKESFYKKRSEAQKEIWDAIEMSRQSEIVERRASFLNEYHNHINSAEWQKTRYAVLSRDKFTCQGCGCKKASEVHHLTYANFGCEFLFQLVAICHECHQRIHGNTDSDVDLRRLMK